MRNFSNPALGAVLGTAFPAVDRPRKSLTLIGFMQFICIHSMAAGDAIYLDEGKDLLIKERVLCLRQALLTECDGMSGNPFAGNPRNAPRIDEILQEIF